MLRAEPPTELHTQVHTEVLLTPLDPALRHVSRTVSSPAVAEQIDRLLAAAPSREKLVDAAIRYRDQLAEREPALADHLLQALNSSGVQEVRADGEPFDARRHDAADSAPTDQARLHDRVATTLRPGYRDGDRPVRLPEVVVYRFAGTDGRPG